jgi:nickel-dependent lactate racemase
MLDVLLDYGSAKMPVELPDGAHILRLSELTNDPPAIDPASAVCEALASPLGAPPIRELAGPGKKVVIAFPDRVKGGSGPLSHRKVSIPIIIEELLKCGIAIEDITLMCAPGLHRHNTVEEWRSYLGKGLVETFLPDRLCNHDAEAPDILDLGMDELGDPVQVNRRFAEADLGILVGHCAGNPYGGYSGGYKMLATGLTSWHSIGSHHCPSTMHRDDWLGASTDSYMRRQFRSIGEAIERGIGKKVFAVDAVLGRNSQVLGVKAGTLSEVEAGTWPIADKRTLYKVDFREPADVLVMGLPRDFHYGPGMGSNPILMGLAVAGQLSRCWEVLREGCVVIAAAICDGWFNPSWFPSYSETYEALQDYCEPGDFLGSADALRITTDPEYRFKYSNQNAYHPFHAMSMISGASILGKRCQAVFIAGAEAPGYARGMGFIPTRTFADAMRLAGKYVGKNAGILCTPDCFSGGVGVHLRLPE